MTEPTLLTEATAWPQERTHIIESCIDDLRASFVGSEFRRETWAVPGLPLHTTPLRDQAYLLQFIAAAGMPFRIVGRLWLYDLRQFTSACMTWLQGGKPKMQARPPLLPSLAWFKTKVFGAPRRKEDKDKTEARLLIDALRQVVADQRFEDWQRRRTADQASRVQGSGNVPNGISSSSSTVGSS